MRKLRLVLGLVLVGLLLCPAHAADALPSPATRPTTVRVAAIQFISRWAMPQANRTALEPLVREAAGHGARIIVLPETAITSYMSHYIRRTWQVDKREITAGLIGVSPEELAETVPGESTQVFGKLAKELGVYLTVPIIERAGNKCFNTSVLIAPDGQIALHYRKLNPWPWAEQGWASKGDRGHQVLDTPYGRLGLLICYDINYEPRAMKELNVDHLLYSIAWVDAPRSDWFDRRLPDIARQSNMNIIGANWSVPDTPGWSGYGQSRIIRRDGTIIARPRSDIGNEILYADLPVPAER